MELFSFPYFDFIHRFAHSMIFSSSLYYFIFIIGNRLTLLSSLQLFFPTFYFSILWWILFFANYCISWWYVRTSDTHTHTLKGNGKFTKASYFRYETQLIWKCHWIVALCSCHHHRRRRRCHACGYLSSECVVAIQKRQLVSIAIKIE